LHALQVDDVYALDSDNLRYITHLELRVDRGREAGGESDACFGEALESAGGHGHFISAKGQQVKKVRAVRAGFGRACCHQRRAFDRHRGIRHGGSGRIRYHSRNFSRGGNLSERRP
jgi:hypothetical protein